jgi:hypothetical protein
MSTAKRTSGKARRPRKSDEMTDEEAAEFYYAHRDDPESADDSVEVRSSKRLSRVVSIRFDPDEASIIEQRAADAGMTMSAYVRQAALERPMVLALDPATLERIREIVTRVVTNSVAEDLAQIRHKIGA